MAESSDMGPDSARLLSLWKIDFQVAKDTVARIAAYKGGSGQETSPLARLNAIVHDKMAALRAQLREWEIVVEEQDSEEESEEMQKLLQQLASQYDTLRLDLRAANVQAKVNTERAAQSERELLLGGGEEALAKKRQLKTEADMASASESVTESLRRTRQMMVQELEHGANTLAAMDASAATLQRTDAEYKGQRSLLARTRHLLSTLQRQDVIERVILFIGVLFFVLVCLFILQKRLLPSVISFNASKPGIPSHTYEPPAIVVHQVDPVDVPQGHHEEL